MEWSSIHRPQVRDVVAAVTFGVLYFGVLWLAVRWGYHPASPVYRGQVLLAGPCTVAVLLARERLPVTTLLMATLVYPVLHGTYMRIEFNILPVLLAAYTVAAKGRLRTVWVVLLAESAVTRMLWPPGSLLEFVWDSQRIWWVNPSRFVLVELVAVLFVLLGRASYRHQLTTTQLRARNQELERLRRVETDQVVAAERTRIARELHDVVAHHISAVVIRAQAADRVADNRPDETREAVRWIAANGQQTLAAIRQVVRVLRSTGNGGPLTPQATLAELPEIAERMGAVGLPVELRLPSAVPLLPAAVELATVRIIQEALTNVLVHAQATRAMVELTLVNDLLWVQVHDDGAADSPPTAPIRMLAAAAVVSKAPPNEQVLPGSASILGGNGLLGMRERAASCGGTLSIRVSPMGGWLLSATLQTTTVPSASSLTSTSEETAAPISTPVAPPARVV